MKLFEF